MMRSYQLSAVSFQLGLCLLAAPGLVRAEGAAPTAPADAGASVTVVVEQNGDTTLDVKRGDVKVKAGGKETRVAAGESVRTQKGKPIKKLLRAPAATAPAEGATLGTVEVGFTWQKVPGAAKYLLEVANAPAAAAAQSQTVDGTKANLHLEAGTYYWRVVALDGEGVAGRRAQPRRLTIDTTPPKLKTGKPEWR
jgi:hypothetical protein